MSSNAGYGLPPNATHSDLQRKFTSTNGWKTNCAALVFEDLGCCHQQVSTCRGTDSWHSVVSGYIVKGSALSSPRLTQQLPSAVMLRGCRMVLVALARCMPGEWAKRSNGTEWLAWLTKCRTCIAEEDDVHPGADSSHQPSAVSRQSPCREAWLA